MLHRSSFRLFCVELQLHTATGLQLSFMSDAEGTPVYITTLWGEPQVIDKAEYEFFDSHVYAVSMSEALVREACEETGGPEEYNVDDTRTELDKAVDKGICCTGVEFTIKQDDDETEWYEGSLTSESRRGNLLNFGNNARIRLSRLDASANARWSASIKMNVLCEDQFTVDIDEKMPDDILVGYWRIDLMPNEQALYNGLQAIKIATKAEGAPMHTLTVRNPLAIRLSSEECKNLKEVNAPSQRVQDWLYEFAVQRGMNKQQVNAFF